MDYTFSKNRAIEALWCCKDWERVSFTRNAKSQHQEQRILVLAVRIALLLFPGSTLGSLSMTCADPSMNSWMMICFMSASWMCHHALSKQSLMIPKDNMVSQRRLSGQVFLVILSCMLLKVLRLRQHLIFLFALVLALEGKHASWVLLELHP